ncbi:hypothetical protein CHLNCDRAFT_132986 [Chlorella variabilis]|uniref:EamA domain-containing protein n=1 Tax=Chlorella variabilis TaxID=554065 RepID=E1Z236_CHLVA|nr:hypothetical protein CHLNCDRAFT_132986 [Chlorella variabilis]EFN59597.1 hypothetical protein CHLNCDRAFT_132986 [Chlorella variabilis]|eukprot:XP_005851699.1 hypothetical protein CHLNCDRAFT_132986 [Chlorella variabilis]
MAALPPGRHLAHEVLLALYGLLSRYAQIKPTLPVPALRLVVVTNLIGEAALLLFHAAPLLVAAQVRRWRRRSWPQPGLPAHGPGDAAAASAKAGDGCCSSSESSEAAGCPPDGDVEQAAGSPPQQHSSPGQPDEQPLQQQQQRRPAPLAHAKTSVRPPLPLARGLSSRFERWEAGRPLLRRRLALAAIVVSFMGCCSLHILAPGFVDVSIVMLTTQWTPLFIAAVQSLLLRKPLPRAFWPSAAVMLGGAGMVIVPAVSQSTSGSLSTARGWWGFAMALGALISTVIYYTLLQACRHMGFTALRLQHYMNLASILLYLPLTLPINGTAWGAQFAGWGATDWAALVSLATVAYMGSGVFMQARGCRAAPRLCVWRLGAPTASMFFGLRLVFSVVLSTPILGSTIIQTGVQIAGVVVTAVAVTAYAGSQWWASRGEQLRQQLAERQAQGEAAAEAADLGASRDGWQHPVHHKQRKPLS